MTIDLTSIITGVILLGAGALTPYLIKIESRIKRLETKDEMTDGNTKKIDILVTSNNELKLMIGELKSMLTNHLDNYKNEKQQAQDYILQLHRLHREKQ